MCRHSVWKGGAAHFHNFGQQPPAVQPLSVQKFTRKTREKRCQRRRLWAGLSWAALTWAWWACLMAGQNEWNAFLHFKTICEIATLDASTCIASVFFFILLFCFVFLWQVNNVAKTRMRSITTTKATATTTTAATKPKRTRSRWRWSRRRNRTGKLELMGFGTWQN